MSDYTTSPFFTLAEAKRNKSAAFHFMLKIENSDTDAQALQLMQDAEKELPGAELLTLLKFVAQSAIAGHITCTNNYEATK